MTSFWRTEGHTGSSRKASGLGVANGGESLDIEINVESQSFLKVKGCSKGGISICFLAVVGLLRRRNANGFGFFSAFEGGFDNEVIAALHMFRDIKIKCLFPLTNDRVIYFDSFNGKIVTMR
jgi:hypothetical protein